MKRDVIGLALLLVAILFLYVFYPSILDDVDDRDPKMSAYNDGWNDVSMFREAVEEDGYETSGIISSPGVLRELKEPERTLLVIIGVEAKYTSVDIQEIVSFVERGGALILADDYGFATDLSGEFGVQFHSLTLWDPAFEKNTSFLKLDVELPDIEGNVKDYEVLANRPTAIHTGGLGTPLAQTSNESYLDANMNGFIDTKDLNGPFEVISLKGKMVFIGDPSIFINEMWRGGNLDNEEFALDLVRFLLPEGGLVLFDESVHAPRSFEEGFYRTVSGTFINMFGELWIGLVVTLVMAGNMLIATTTVRDPKLWHHDLALGEKVPGNLQFMEENFKGRTLDIKNRLRDDVIDLIMVRAGRRREDFSGMTDRQIRTLVGDVNVYKFVKGEDIDLDDLFKRLERWL